MAVKKPGDNGYKTLKSDINSGNLRSLYLLWGEEDYLREYYFGEMKKQILPQGLEQMNHARFDGKNTDVSALEDAVDALPAFSPRKLIEVRDFDFYKCAADRRERLERLLEDIPDYCCLVFVFTDPAFKPDGRMKIHQKIKAGGLAVEFKKQEQTDLMAWIRRRFAAMDKEIDRREAEYLIFLCGSLMTGLISEIEKIAAYAKGRQITRGDIDAVGTPVLDAVVFKLTDALGQKNFDEAAQIMGELLLMRESPIMILAVMGKQLRQIFSARLALDAGRDAGYIKGLWGLRSDYPARLLMTTARRFSLHWCREAVALAAQTDLRMKSTGADGQQLLCELLIHLAADEVSYG